MNGTGPDINCTATGDAAPRPVAPPGTWEQDRVERRRPRHRQVRVLAAVVTVAAMVAAASVAVLLRARPGEPAAMSPLDALSSALARTAADSYSFSLDATMRVGGRNRGSEAASGVVDPKRHLGMEQLVDRSVGGTTRAQVRFAGAELYTLVPSGFGFGKPWDESPAAAVSGAMPPGDLYGFASDRPVSPEALAVVLRAAGVTAHRGGTVSGPGWTGIGYTFAARLDRGLETVTGTVYVDQQGHVRRLMTVTAEEGQAAIGKPSSLTTERDITFAEFGVPVSVTAPPPEQVKHTSGEPYWGLYF
jgi:hypothetical protein